MHDSLFGLPGSTNGKHNKVLQRVEKTGPGGVRAEALTYEPCMFMKSSNLLCNSYWLVCIAMIIECLILIAKYTRCTVDFLIAYPQTLHVSIIFQADYISIFADPSSQTKDLSRYQWMSALFHTVSYYYYDWTNWYRQKHTLSGEGCFALAIL